MLSVVAPHNLKWVHTLLVLWLRNLVFRLVNKLKATCVLFLLIHYDRCQISQDIFYKFLKNRLAFGLHRWACIDFYEPNFQVFVYHEIVAVKLKTILSIIDFVLNALSWSSYIFLDLRPYHFIIDTLDCWVLIAAIWLKKGAKLITWPYIIIFLFFFRIVFIAILFFEEVLNNAVVSQMRIFVCVFAIVILSCHSDIALRIGPDCQWIPVGNENPLS